MNRLKHLVGLCIYKIAPIKRNKYVFTSFNGHYSDNPKYISMKLHEMDEKAEIVWLVTNNHRADLPEYVKAVDIESLKAYWHRGRAMTQVDNVYGFRANFKTSESKVGAFKLKLMEVLGST